MDAIIQSKMSVYDKYYHFITFTKVVHARYTLQRCLYISVIIVHMITIVTMLVGSDLRRSRQPAAAERISTFSVQV